MNFDNGNQETSAISIAEFLIKNKKSVQLDEIEKAVPFGIVSIRNFIRDAAEAGIVTKKRSELNRRKIIIIPDAQKIDSLLKLLKKYSFNDALKMLKQDLSIGNDGMKKIIFDGDGDFWNDQGETEKEESEDSLSRLLFPNESEEGMSRGICFLQERILNGGRFGLADLINECGVNISEIGIVNLTTFVRMMVTLCNDMLKGKARVQKNAESTGSKFVTKITITKVLGPEIAVIKLS